LERINWVKGFVRDHTFTSVYFFANAYTTTWQNSIGFVFRDLLVVCEHSKTTSYRNSKDLVRLDSYLKELAVDNTAKVRSILDTIENNSAELILLAEKINGTNLGDCSIAVLAVNYRAFYELSLKFWDYYSFGYYFADALSSIKDKQVRLALEGQIERIRSDMPYIRCEKIILKKLFLELSKRLLVPESVLYYLTPAELLKIFESKTSIKQSLVSTTLQRKKFGVYLYTKGRREILCGVSAEKQFAKQMDPFEKTNPPSVLTGVTASVGTIEGKAFIVKSKKDLTRVPVGSIVVVTRLMPEEMIYVMKSKGIVSEEGGAGSHVAILSREYKIPCIVGVHNATVSIKEGDLLEFSAKRDKGVIIKKR